MLYSQHSPVWEVVTRYLAVVLLVLCCIALPAPLSAQRSTIGGHVYLEDNTHPAKGVTVDLLGAEHTPVSTARTDDSGEFRFGGLAIAQYFVTVELSDYDPVSISIDLNYEVDHSLNIYLKSITKGRDPISTLSVSAHELSMPHKARKLFASGQKKLYEQQDAKAAVDEFEKALTVAPAYYEASYQLGMAYLALNNSPLAEMAFRKSIESSGDTYGEADVRLGALLLDHSDPNAESVIRKGVQLSPNFWRAHYELGRVLVSQKQVPEALSAAEKARELAPKMASVYRLLSSIHFLQGNYPALLQDLDTYISLDPNSRNGSGAKELRDEIQQKLSHQSPPSPHP
jgi:tetratricopeptide (TPR) repeat protein